MTASNSPRSNPTGRFLISATCSFRDSLAVISNAVLSVVYEYGLEIGDALVQRFDNALVKHKYIDNGMNIDRYIAWAVPLTLHYWKAVHDYLNAYYPPWTDEKEEARIASAQEHFTYKSKESPHDKLLPWATPSKS
jgi:hypothetical protein